MASVLATGLVACKSDDVAKTEAKAEAKPMAQGYQQHEKTAEAKCGEAGCSATVDGKTANAVCGAKTDKNANATCGASTDKNANAACGAKPDKNANAGCGAKK